MHKRAPLTKVVDIYEMQIVYALHMEMDQNS